ncbi:MAG: hypothetical protein Q7R52_03135 [archaeon]|nr:hypothetical protein [archaeon]
MENNEALTKDKIVYSEEYSEKVNMGRLLHYEDVESALNGLKEDTLKRKQEYKKWREKEDGIDSRRAEIAYAEANSMMHAVSDVLSDVDRWFPIFNDSHRMEDINKKTLDGLREFREKHKHLTYEEYLKIGE